MKITLMCNAGLMLQADNTALMVDLPNEPVAPFYALPDDEWNKICRKSEPYKNVCGFFFTHVHKDHLDMRRLAMYPTEGVSMFLPSDTSVGGRIKMGEFLIEYKRIEHASIDNAPNHVVALISVEDKSIYVAGDAKLDTDEHEAFLNGRRVNAAFWNAMYLSREQTRRLMKETADRNFIYHLPFGRDSFGIWAKCDKNCERYANELKNVELLREYPSIKHI